MQGPKMLPSALFLLGIEPNIPQFSAPAFWLVDSQGVSHTQRSHINGVYTKQFGKLVDLLLSKLCQRNGCVTLIRAASEQGEELGRYAQLYSEANDLVSQYNTICLEKPFLAVDMMMAIRKKINGFDFLGKLISQDKDLHDNLYLGVYGKLDNHYKHAQDFSNSISYREKLKGLAIAELVIGVNGPYQGIRELIKSSAKESPTGRLVHFLPQKFQDAHDVRQLKLDLPILVPQEIEQLEKLSFNIEGDFTVYSLIDCWRREISQRLEDLDFDLVNYREKLLTNDNTAVMHLKHDGEFFGNPSSEINLKEIKVAFAYPGYKDILVLPEVVAIWLEEKYKISYVLASNVSKEKIAMLSTFISDGGLYGEVSEAWETVEKLNYMLLSEQS
jgi:hypothetical protein